MLHDIHEALTALKFGGIMIYPLMALAVLALAVVLDKAFVYWRYVRLPADLLGLVETYNFAWPDLARRWRRSSAWSTWPSRSPAPAR